MSLRILAIAPTSFFSDYGCHVRIRGQMAEMRRRGHRVLLCTYPSGNDVPGLTTARPMIPARRLQVGSSWQKVLLDVTMIPLVLRRALSMRPDVIHAYLHEGVLLGSMAAKLLRRPLVFDFQGSLTAEMVEHRFLRRDSPLFPLWLGLERRLDRLPDVILASSNHAGKLLTEKFGLSPDVVETVHDSVDPASFHPPSPSDAERIERLRAALGVPAGRQVVAYLGLLAPYQGVDVLLAAAKEIVAVSGEAAPHFLVMGFPFVDRYRRMAERMGIGKQVTFTGRIPYDAASDYLALGDVAVAPKLPTTEGSGKLCPYMAMGLPVVAADAPAQREYLGDLGIYVPPGDAHALASALQNILADEAMRRSLGTSLREKAIHRFTWAHAGDAMEKVYARVLGR
jgi:glycosyltransferase involved in cell wall biosynthesis